MRNTRYISQLQSFYDEKGLLVSAFHCQHANACAKAAGCSLSQGAEAHVGARYGKDLRLVVVSLDTGGANDSMDRRRHEIEGLHPNGATNPHMKGTTQLLEVIYGTESGNLYELYAMTNAAKCSRGDAGRKKVSRVLYQNCSEYVVPELTCLDPQMIVTQGNEAWWALGAEPDLSAAHQSDLDDWIADQTASAVIRDWLRSLAKEYLSTTSVADSDVLTLKTIHPSAQAGQWQRFRRTALQPVVAMAKHLATRP